MKALARFAVTGLVLTLAVSSASAQLINNPTYFTPKAGTGLTVAGEYGLGLNNNSGKGYSINARGELALPMISVSAGLGQFQPQGGGNGTINFFGGAGMTLMSLPLTGVSVSAHAAAGYFSKSGTNSINVPIGLTLGIKPPSPGVSFEPWVSARIHYTRTSAGGFSASTTNVGAGAGVNVGLPMGLGLHAALDYLAVSGGAPILFGIGAHYTFTVPGLGAVPGT
jgi:hypothetical protein